MPRPGCPIVYLTNNGIGEPHVASQVLPYLERSGGRKVFLLTCEKQDRDEQAAAEALRRLEAMGGEWWSTPFAGPPLGTLRNVRALARQATRIARRHGRVILHGRAYVGAEAARRAARASGSPWIFDMRGFYLEERIDDGRLRRGSLEHRLLRRHERRLLREADCVVVLSEAAREALARGDLGVRPDDVRVVPCAVDLKAFQPWAGGVLQAPSLVYSGSVGPGYLVDAMGAFAAILHRQAGWTLKVASRQPGAPLAKAAIAQGMPASSVTVTTLVPSQVPAFLQQADAGILFLRASLAKVASSPIKVGEYLACGIPVVLSPGCGDASTWVAQDRVRVVVDPESEVDLEGAAARIRALAADPDTRQRCREAARRRLDVVTAAATYARLYRDLEEA